MSKGFVFECNNNTFLECIEKGLFGSNVPWPLQVKQGDFCVLRHYEIGKVFALWRATSDGGKKLVAKAWGGSFPFQTRIRLVTPEIVEIPKQAIDDFIVNPSTGRFDNVLEDNRAEGILQVVKGMTQVLDG